MVALLVKSMKGGRGLCWSSTTSNTTMLTHSMKNDVSKQKPLTFKLLLRLYYLPFFIFVLGFGLYYFIFRIHTYEVAALAPTLAEDSPKPISVQPTEPEAVAEAPVVLEQPEPIIPTESIPTAPNLVSETAFVVDVRSANVRNNPSSDAPIIAALSRGNIVEVIKNEKGWAKIAINGTEGWVASRLLRPLDSTIQTPQSPTLVTTHAVYEVNVRDINVREQPSTNSRVVAKKTQGQTIIGFEEKNGWVRTEEGWLFKNLLKLKEN